MKTLSITPVRFLRTLLAAVSCIVSCPLASPVGAAILWWDPNGTTSVGGNGTWNTTSAQWSSTSAQSSSLVVWNSTSAAGFCAGPGSSSQQGVFTVAVNSAITFAGIFNGSQSPGPCDITLNGTGSLSFSGQQAFSTFNASLGFTRIQVPLTGTGQLVAESSGQLSLEAANTYSGGTLLGFSGAAFSGLINFNNASSFGSGTITFQSLGNGGALVLEGASAVTIPNAVTVSSSSTNNIVGNTAGLTFSGNWSLGANTLFVGSGGNANNLVTISGVISGTGNFGKLSQSPSGILQLTGVNTYTGTTTNLSGTLTIGGAGKLNNGSYAGNIFNNAVFNYASSAAQTLSGVISGSGSITKAGTGSLVLSGANTYSGKTIVNGGTLTINTSGDSCLGTAPASPVADQLTLNAGATFSLGSAANASLSANRGITLGGAAAINLTSKDLTIPGIIAGTGPLTKSGANALILGGANTFSGGVALTGGTLTVNNNTSLGTGALTITPAGICTIAGKNGTTTLTNPITANPGGGQVIDFFATTGNALTLNGQITGTGNIFRGNGGGAGTLTINANNSGYNGTFTLQQGPLVLGHQNALGVGTFVVTPGGIAITLGANTALTGASAVTNAVTLNGTLPVSTTSDLELAGVLSGASGAVTKSGAGALILSGANTYAGGTTVSGGALLVKNSSGSGTGSGAVAVNAGATLGGNGSISGVVTVNSGGSLAPGGSIGTLTLGASPILAGTVLAEIDSSASPNADKLVVSGNPLAYGGVLTVNNVGPALVGGEVFDLFDATSFSGSFATFNLPALSAGLNWYMANLNVDGTIVVNRAPTAQDKAYSRAKGLSLKIFKSDLLAGSTDPDVGDSVSYDALVSPGSQGATVTEDANLIYYQPANDNNDTLQFRLKDTRGGTVTKNISIMVTSSTGQAQTITVTGDSAVVTFAGIPGLSYDVQRSTNLTDWVTLLTTNAPAEGVFSVSDNFSDLGAPPAPSSAYYRLHQP